MSTSNPDHNCRSSNDATEIVFSVDKGDDENSPDRAIISDITRDGAWIATRVTDAPVLSAWR